MIKIIPLNDADKIKQTAKMAAGVFNYIALHVRLTFWAYKHKNRVTKFILRLLGIKEQIIYWVAINEQEKIVGTIGLYSMLKDSHEAVWMAYLCVDPGSRRQGIGRVLVEYAIEQAKAIGVPYFKLYTSTMQNEVNSHSLYHEYGFRVTKVKQKLFYKLLYMQLNL